MALYFIGKYVDDEDGNPVLLQRVNHDLSLDAAEALTTEYNLRAGHAVTYVEIRKTARDAAYFMYDSEQS